MRKTFKDYPQAIIPLFLFILLGGNLPIAAQTAVFSRVEASVVTDEAEAVLEILKKKEARAEITDADWRKVFATEGYTRLKKRELSLSRPFEEADFKTFVLSDELFLRRAALRQTLEEWKKIDVRHPAELALDYLPSNARIRAKIYPVIKPRDNSFVFDIPDDPAIFLYLDPSVGKEEFENTLAHELHHIGYGTVCSRVANSETEKLAPEKQKVFKWLGAFGEGFAMIAAAGGSDVHPHRASSAENRVRWDVDVANFNRDLKTVEKFFLDLDGGKLSEKEELETARGFYGVQGPWYTIGWQMAAVIEKTFGREKLIECFCDARKLPPTYNEAVEKYNRKHKKSLAGWSDDFLRKLKN